MQNVQMTQDKGNDPFQGVDPQEKKTRLIAQHTVNASQESSNGIDGCTTSSGGGNNCLPNNGGSAVDETSTWDDPNGFEMLWSDDADSATTPLTKAAKDGDAAAIKELAKRSTFDAFAKISQLALLIACRQGHLDVVKTLLDAGVDVHCKDPKSNWQPIHIATYRDDVKVVEMLAMHGEWRKGVSLVRFKSVTCSLLHLASHFGCIAVLRYLLSHTVRLGLHIEVRDAAHWTALHHAAFEGKIQAVALLLQTGADINCTDPHGVSPLHASAYRDHIGVVRLLLCKGANPKMMVRSASTARKSNKRLPRFEISPMPEESPAAWRKTSLETILVNHHRKRCWSPSLSGTPDIATNTGTVGRWKEHSGLSQRYASTGEPMGHFSYTGQSFSTLPAYLRRQLNNFSPSLYPIVDYPQVCPKTCSHERGFERVEPLVKFHEGSSLLHWAASKGYEDLVADLLARGLIVEAIDTMGRTPLGLAVWNGHNSIVHMLLHEKVQLAEEDKNWFRIEHEEEGLTIVRILEETEVSPLDSCKSDGFNLLHLAANNGYPNMLHRLLSLKVSPDLCNNQGETPLFVAIRSNQLACVQQLINAGAKLNVYDNRGGTALHMAAKNGNVTVIDMLLTTSENEQLDIDINRTDNIGYTAVYYALNSCRYDIVQRFLEFSLLRQYHVKATKTETLLQFYTERNNLGQYDNAVVRVLECEKLLHSSKANAEMCLRVQLGTTESSTKARIQLQQMYESTKAQRHCWNFWFFLSCFLLPSIFYYLDVYTDILLAVEYYQDYQDVLLNNSDFTNGTNATDLTMKTFWEIFNNVTESQHKINFVLTVFFILFPMSLLSVWNLYIHVTQPDILPMFRKLPEILRRCLYTLVFMTPLAPVMAYLENTYAQMKHMNVTARSLQEVDSKSYNNFPGYGNTKTYRHCLRDQKIRKYYDLKHVAQMRVAITNVMEATLESAFQLILQLYIVGTQYQDLTKVGEVTLRKILSFSSDGPDTRLSKQVFSVLISLVSLTWSFTSYHRFSKLGGLSILSALPLLFAIFFQVVSRAIACTIFTLSYKWKIFVVLGVHFIVVLMFKLKLEERSLLPPRKYSCFNCFLSTLRPYFYVFLGTIASTLVYFRLERPSAVKKQLSRRHSTVIIQMLFMFLAFIENFVLLSTGIVGLEGEQYDPTFKTVSVILCTLSYIIGVVLHGVYYGCFGHPWVDINGPTITKDAEEGTWVMTYYKEGNVNRWVKHSCCRFSRHSMGPTDNVYLPPHLLQTKLNGVHHRQVKDI